MAQTRTVSINGKHYDARTGLPVENSGDSVEVVETVTETPTEAARSQAAVAATAVHQTTQKSKTLRRPKAKKTPISHAAQSKKKGAMDIVSRSSRTVHRSPAISRFAAAPVIATPTATAQDEAPVAHPLVKKHTATHATTKQHPSQKKAQPSAAALKEHAIQKAFEASQPAKQHKAKKRFPRILSTASASLAIILLAGYLTYLNMPTISIRVAAAQSGINASYPSYRPTGYRLSGPIAYNDGEVSMRFASNSGPRNFTVTEKKTNWDSSAVLENHVQPKSNGSYIPHKRGGLTIYTYGNNAAWVNGGILYTIEGDAPLSDEQILRIATSL